jgi:cytoskeleton protein RodZ
MLAAVESPAAGQEAEQPVVYGAVTHDMMSTTKSGSDEPKTPRVEAPAGSEPSPAPQQAVVDGPALGASGTLALRLRAAREAKGWSTEEVGSRLRLPAQIIRTLEAEQYDKIGHGVYLRGYLSSYARLVDVPTVLVDRVMGERNHAPPLITSGTISHSRYLYQRYSVSALYLILTGVIIVPAVLLAMRASLQPAITQLTPLDAPASSTPADATAVPANELAIPQSGANGAAADATPAVPPTGTDAPLIASLAPFSALSQKDSAAHVETPAAAAGAHTVKLVLKEASWVEVTSAAGEKLEYGLLPAGSVRTYASDKALEVRLGNCNGAEVEADGKVQDLTPYRRANVAHFKLFYAGEPISRTDG